MPVALPAGLRFSFTETMRGFWTSDPALDAQSAFEQGREHGRSIEFTLTIRTDDLAAFLEHADHECGATGTLTVDATPYTVTEGRFNLFIDDPRAVGVRLMRYRLNAVAGDGRRLFLDGTKTIRDDPALDLWADTTTLEVTLHEGDGPTARLLGRGVMHILPADFAHQLTTMKVANAPDPITELAALAAFGRFFGGVLFDTYGTIAAPLTAFDPAAPPRKRRILDAPIPEVYPFRAYDGTALRLTRYRGGSKGPVMLAHGLGVSSRIFSTDLIQTNLVEYLCRHGFDLWLLDYRASVELPAARTEFSADEVATDDYPAAVATIRAITGAESVQAIVHCFGATAFSMAMMAGLEGVRSAVISQIAAHVVTNPITQLKAGLHLPNMLATLGIGSLTAAATRGDNAFVQLLDELLRLQEPRIGKRCTSRTCHRISFMYAPLYEHAQLNSATHERLSELFGVANMRAFEHLALIVRSGKIVDAAGRDVYLPSLAALAAIPTTIIHGARNECYLPASTERTHALLREAAPGVARARHLIDGYGHIDCIFGKDAARDVYPRILEHLETIGS